MDGEVEMRTLEEALACLKRHFTESDGLIAQIERGWAIDEAEVQRLEIALRKLYAAWQDQDLVPKQDVRLLGNVVPR